MTDDDEAPTYRAPEPSLRRLPGSPLMVGRGVRRTMRQVGVGREIHAGPDAIRTEAAPQRKLTAEEAARFFNARALRA